MTDYQVEAKDNLTLALTKPNGYMHLSTTDLIQIAQVNATLELAEQQRIANLLALAQFDHNPARGDRLFTSLEGSAKLRLQACEALGIS